MIRFLVWWNLNRGVQPVAYELHVALAPLLLDAIRRNPAMVKYLVAA